MQFNFSGFVSVHNTKLAMESKVKYVAINITLSFYDVNIFFFVNVVLLQEHFFRNCTSSNTFLPKLCVLITK